MNNNKPIRAERQTVRFFDGLEVDGYRMPNGEFRVGLASASRAIGFNRDWLSDVISESAPKTAMKLKSVGFTGDTETVIAVTSKGNSLQDRTISQDDFELLVLTEARKGNPVALAAKGIKPFDKIKNSNKTEKQIQLRLFNQLGGAIEISCLAGKIDLLTSTEIIEIKRILDWKSALGQVLAYSKHYPSHQKRIHLFGETQESFLVMIKDHCDPLNVKVTWER